MRAERAGRGVGGLRRKEGRRPGDGGCRGDRGLLDEGRGYHSVQGGGLQRSQVSSRGGNIPFPVGGREREDCCVVQHPSFCCGVVINPFGIESIIPSRKRLQTDHIILAYLNDMLLSIQVHVKCVCDDLTQSRFSAPRRPCARASLPCLPASSRTWRSRAGSASSPFPVATEELIRQLKEASLRLFVSKQQCPC